MTVGAFTNAVGDYSQFEVRHNTYVGEWWNSSGTHPVSSDSSVSVETAFSIKNPAVHGEDRITAYDYQRTMGKVNFDVPYELTDRRIFSSTDGQEVRYRTYLSTGSSYPRSLGDPPEWAGIRNNNASLCLTKALVKLRDGRVQNGADIGEAKKTADMIARDLSQLLAAYKAARAGNWSAIPRILGMNWRDIISGRFFANRWLEYQYGWKPLIGSIYDNVGILSDLMKKKDATFKVSHTGRVGYSTNHNGPQLVTWDMNSRCTVAFIARPNNHLISSLDQQGLLNPLSIAWELTPFSFVIDWCLPVGEMLDALTSTLGLDFVSGFRNLTNSRTRTAVWNAALLGPSESLQTPGNYQVELYDFRRFAFRSWPWPEMYLKFSPFSSTHIANALALLSQLSGRRF